MRADGATESEIEAMLVELEQRYAFGANVEGELVVAVLREAMGLRFSRVKVTYLMKKLLCRTKVASMRL